jgi:hypothetical protein
MNGVNLNGMSRNGLWSNGVAAKGTANIAGESVIDSSGLVSVELPR